jgi:tyrosine-protein kinase Etk/Wzc
MPIDTPSQPLLPPSAEDDPGQGIDLLAVVAALLAEWRLMLTVFAIVTVLGVLLVFSLRSRFVATATILPEFGHSEGDALSALFSSRTPGTIFAGLFRSRSVADDVIDHANLLAVYKTTSQSKARAALAGQSSFDVGGDGMLTISIKDPDSKTAAAIANAYLDAMTRLDLNMAQDQSRQMQSLFDEQLEQEKQNLFQAEDRLEQVQRQTGLVQPEAQARIGLDAIAAIRAQIVNLRVQLASVLQGATAQNPEVQRLRSQIGQLEAQESALENGQSSPMGAAPPAGSLPQTGLDIARAQRDVEYHEALVRSLSTQYEQAQLSGNLTRPAFQVVDRAVAPEIKAWPPRKIFVLAVLMLAALLGLSAAVLRRFFHRIVDDPANAASLAAIRQAFARR